MAEDIAKKHLARNFWLGVASGVGYNLFQALANTGVVLTWYVSELTSSNLLISLLMPIEQGGWFFPQLLMSGYLQRQHRSLPLYQATAALRAGAVGLMALLTFLLDDPIALLVSFFVLYTVNSVLAGVAGLPFMDVIAKTIPPTRRGSYFSWRRLLGGSLALAGGVLVKFVLSPDSGLDFPNTFALLFFFAFLATVVQVGTFSLIIEPESEDIDTERVSLVEQLRRASKLPFQHRTYGRYLVVRLAIIAANIAMPFYAVYARWELGASEEMVGIYLIGSTLAGVLSNIFWGRVSDRRGNRLLMQFVALTAILAPALALLIGNLPAIGLDKTHVFTLVFISYGMHQTATFIGGGNYVLELAPARKRAMYIGFSNTMIGLALFLSPVGGLIVDWLGYELLFLIAVVFSAVAILVSLKLEEPREALAAASSPS
jgi:MFS family permease